MPKSLMIAGNAQTAVLTRSGAGSESTYFAAANAPLVFDATRANTQITFRTPGVISNVRVYIHDNSLSAGISTVKTEINGSTGSIAINIPKLTTGLKQDVANSDAVPDGGKVNFVLTIPAGTAGQLIALSFVSFNFTSSDQTMVRHAATNFAQQVNANTTYIALCDNCSTLNTSQAYADFRCRAPGAFRNLFLYISQWTDTSGFSSTIDILVNGTPSGTLTILKDATHNTGAAPQLIELTGVDVSIAAGDNVCLRHVTAGTGSITLEIVSVEWISTTKQFYMIYGNTGSGMSAGPAVDHYMSGGGGGDMSAIAEVAMRTPIGFAASVSNLTTYISSDTIDSLPGASSGTPFYVRKNGANGTCTFQVPEGAAAAQFEDTTHADTFAAADEISLFEDGVGTHGVITWRHIGVMVKNTEAAVQDIIGRGMIPWAR